MLSFWEGLILRFWPKSLTFQSKNTKILRYVRRDQFSHVLNLIKSTQVSFLHDFGAFFPQPKNTCMRKPVSKLAQSILVKPTTNPYTDLLNLLLMEEILHQLTSRYGKYMQILQKTLQK